MAVSANPEEPVPVGADVIEQAKQKVLAGQFHAAVAGLTAHLDTHPDDALAWRRLSGALIGARFLPRAIAAADRAIELAPDEPIAYRNRAVAHLELKNYAAMRADAERALALNGDDAEALTLVAFGVLLLDRDMPRAQSLWERAYTLDPDHRAVSRLGLSLRAGRRRGLLLGAAPAAFAAVLALGLGVVALEPELPWMLWPAGVFAAFLIVVLPIRLRTLPPLLAGPGALAAAVVGAALVVGACTFAATRSLPPALALEMVTAVLGAVLSIRQVLLWACYRRGTRRPTTI